MTTKLRNATLFFSVTAILPVCLSPPEIKQSFRVLDPSRNPVEQRSKAAAQTSAVASARDVLPAPGGAPLTQEVAPPIQEVDTPAAARTPKVAGPNLRVAGLHSDYPARLYGYLSRISS